MTPYTRPAPTRTIADLTADERRVIRQRANGWESASPGLLALVFSVPVQAINAVLREGSEPVCAACGKALCGHNDLIFAGVVPANGA